MSTMDMQQLRDMLAKLDEVEELLEQLPQDRSLYRLLEEMRAITRGKLYRIEIVLMREVRAEEMPPARQDVRL